MEPLRLASQKHFGARLPGLGDPRMYARDFLRFYEWPHVRIRKPGVTAYQHAGGLYQAGREFRLDGSFHVEALRGNANLTCVVERAPSNQGNGVVQVRIGQHDGGGVAPVFRGQARAVRHLAPDVPAHLGRTDEGDEVDQRAFHEACGPASGHRDDLQYPDRKSLRGEVFGQPSRAQRGACRRLQHTDVSCGQGRADLVAGEV